MIFTINVRMMLTMMQVATGKWKELLSPWILISPGSLPRLNGRRPANKRKIPAAASIAPKIINGMASSFIFNHRDTEKTF